MKKPLGLLASLLLLSAPVFAISGHHFDRVMIVVFENTNEASASKQAFFKKVAKAGVNFTNLSAETHPSQGNYIAMVSGSVNGVTGDGNVNLNVRHIADLLEARGLTWKVYAEDYPGNCSLRSKGVYARKHNPFISFVNIQQNPVRCANIVNAKQLDQDIATGHLPDYLFYVPNLKNDGHDTGVGYADRWYRGKFEKLFADPTFMAGTLVVTTFDEDDGSNRNQIYTSLFGPMVKSQTTLATPLNHYSVLRMVEENWDLGNLGKNDRTAPVVPSTIWK